MKDSLIPSRRASAVSRDATSRENPPGFHPKRKRYTACGSSTLTAFFAGS